MTNIYINFNGIKFNIICNEEHFEKLNKLFNKMFASNSDVDVLNYNYNIHYIEDFKIYELLESARTNSIVTTYEPNIEKFFMKEDEFFYSKASYYVTNNGIDYYVYTTNNKYAPYYVMLELIQRTFEMNKQFIYHGTALSIDNINMSFIGNTRSGKTTIMSKLFQSNLPNKRFLSNDRIIIGEEYTSSFPIDIHLNPIIANNDSFLKNAKIDKSGYIKPGTIIDLYQNVQLCNSQKNDVIILPRIDLINKNDLDIIDMDCDVIEILNDCCFTITDKETKRDNWLVTPQYSKTELEKMINYLNEYLFNNYKIFQLKYGCNLKGEEIYEKIRRKI